MAVTLRASDASPAPGAELAVDRIRSRVCGCGSATSRRDGRARGTVVILTGRAEFIEKYEETVNDLAFAGYAVAALRLARPRWVRALPGLPPARPRHADRRLPGRPRGGPRASRAASAAAAVADARPLDGRPCRTAPAGGRPAAVRRRRADRTDVRHRPAAAARPRGASDLPAGHRFGAGPRYALGQRDFDPAASPCPKQADHLPGPLRRLFAPGRGDAGVRSIGGVTYHWLAASLRSIARTRRPGYVEAMRLPVLVCQVGDERVVCNRSITALAPAAAAGSAAAVFPKARHELLRERDPIRRDLSMPSGLLRRSGHRPYRKRAQRREPPRPTTVIDHRRASACRC